MSLIARRERLAQLNASGNVLDCNGSINGGMSLGELSWRESLMNASWTGGLGNRKGRGKKGEDCQRKKTPKARKERKKGGSLCSLDGSWTESLMNASWTGNLIKRNLGAGKSKKSKANRNEKSKRKKKSDGDTKSEKRQKNRKKGGAIQGGERKKNKSNEKKSTSDKPKSKKSNGKNNECDKESKKKKKKRKDNYDVHNDSGSDQGTDVTGGYSYFAESTMTSTIASLDESYKGKKKAYFFVDPTGERTYGGTDSNSRVGAVINGGRRRRTDFHAEASGKKSSQENVAKSRRTSDFVTAERMNHLRKKMPSFVSNPLSSINNISNEMDSTPVPGGVKKLGHNVVYYACDEATGMCAFHPDIQLRKRSRFGGWKDVLRQCPKCAASAADNHMPRSSSDRDVRRDRTAGPAIRGYEKDPKTLYAKDRNKSDKEAFTRDQMRKARRQRSAARHHREMSGVSNSTSSRGFKRSDSEGRHNRQPSDRGPVRMPYSDRHQRPQSFHHGGEYRSKGTAPRSHSRARDAFENGTNEQTVRSRSNRTNGVESHRSSRKGLAKHNSSAGIKSRAPMAPSSSHSNNLRDSKAHHPDPPEMNDPFEPYMTNGVSTRKSYISKGTASTSTGVSGRRAQGTDSIAAGRASAPYSFVPDCNVEDFRTPRASMTTSSYRDDGGSSSVRPNDTTSYAYSSTISSEGMCDRNIDGKPGPDEFTSYDLPNNDSDYPSAPFPAPTRPTYTKQETLDSVISDIAINEGGRGSQEGRKHKQSRGSNDVIEEELPESSGPVVVNKEEPLYHDPGSECDDQSADKKSVSCKSFQGDRRRDFAAAREHSFSRACKVAQKRKSLSSHDVFSVSQTSDAPPPRHNEKRKSLKGMSVEGLMDYVMTSSNGKVNTSSHSISNENQRPGRKPHPDDPERNTIKNVVRAYMDEMEVDPEPENHATHLPWKLGGGKFSGMYTGEINSKREPHGEGILIFNNGSSVEGRWIRGIPQPDAVVEMMDNTIAIMDEIAPRRKETYSPISDIPAYSIGDEGKRRDMIKDDSAEIALMRIAALQPNDNAFIRRTDGTWRFSKVKKVSSDMIICIVNDKGSFKAYERKYWVTHIRVPRVAMQCQNSLRERSKSRSQSVDRRSKFASAMKSLSRRPVIDFDEQGNVKLPQDGGSFAVKKRNPMGRRRSVSFSPPRHWER